MSSILKIDHFECNDQNKRRFADKFLALIEYILFQIQLKGGKFECSLFQIIKY